MSPLLLQLHLHKVLEKQVAAAVAIAVAVKQNSKSCRIFVVSFQSMSVATLNSDFQGAASRRIQNKSKEPIFNSVGTMRGRGLSEFWLFLL